MKEIEHYDKAVAQFNRTQSFLALPITSWDVFALRFSKICNDLNDIHILNLLSKNQGWEKDMLFEKEIIDEDYVVVVTDTQLNIVHTTKNMVAMNGYHNEEVIGKKPKMFQGPKTCRETTSKISNAIKKNQPFEAVILNYRKDGSTYNCWIKASPIKNSKGDVVNFIAFEREVA